MGSHGFHNFASQKQVEGVCGKLIWGKNLGEGLQDLLFDIQVKVVSDEGGVNLGLEILVASKGSRGNAPRTLSLATSLRKVLARAAQQGNQGSQQPHCSSS